MQAAAGPAAVRDDDSVAGLSIHTVDSVATPSMRPILVGYAFGPKKMSSMGIVMAEASKAQLSTVITAEIPVVIETRRRTLNVNTGAMDSPSHVPLTSAALARAQSPRAPSERVTFSIFGGPNGGLRNIVRHFRSSCSSVATSEGTSNTSTTATATTAHMPPSSSSSARRHPVRVSFVPLDMDTPLEEQHGGQLDVILHKLTEDILCLSTMQNQNDAPEQQTYSQAKARVHRLTQYLRNHPQCSLVDHPSHVQVVMSRSDIAHVLQRSLVGVTSATGIPVRTPRFQVISHAAATCDQTSLPLPLIAKPLQAAGTKKSHCMGVVLHSTGLSKVEMPCLLQEYANHNATLFKVYVLGSHVSVFERPSLPNLPCGTTAAAACHDYVEFDSQRPYPTLEAFGYYEVCSSNGNETRAGGSDSDMPEAKRPRTSRSGTTRAAGCPVVTVDEIRPVVKVLAKAFGLELFGFDILVTADTQNRPEMLVVDVNYFPSYKEVSNFPSLLANYLTQRAIEGRMKQPS